MEITVVTFFWVGDRWIKDGNSLDYINRLYRGVKRNLSHLKGFVLFSNEKGLSLDNGIEQRRFEMPSKKGVLPRMWMYSKDAQLSGQILSLDLDLVIVGSLDNMSTYRGDFIVRSKFAPNQQHKADGDIIGFRAEANFDIWEKFTSNIKYAENITGGRERWWLREVRDCKDRWQNLFPGEILSYKRHVRNKGGDLPMGARIISCHGHPRPHEINERWRKENWI